MMTDYSYTAVAAFVPEPFRKQLADCSRLLGEKYKSWYVLNEDEFPPHVTMWIAYVPTRNLDVISSTTQNALQNVSGIEISTGNVKVEDGGYVSVEINVTQRLRELHKLLLAHLNKFREGYLSQKYMETMHTYSKEQQESLKMYGTRAAGNLFAPHTTIGIASADSVSAIKQNVVPTLNSLQHIKFPIRELIFFRQGKPGRSIELINRYQLL